MRNKMFIILGSILVLFVALYFVVDAKNKKTIGDHENPYGKDNLSQSTINQLDDPLYQNQIIPDDLDKELANEKDMTVYFYSPECDHCKRATPILMPVVEDLDIDMKKLNLLEFKNDWNTYRIEGTPTLVHYENGKEVARLNGARTAEEFRAFLNEYVVD
jgi:thiol-disulfide isomerase/thioredoxin